MDDYLTSLDFKRSDEDPCVYVKDSNALTYNAIYVDDLIIASSSEVDLLKVKKVSRPASK